MADLLTTRERLVHSTQALLSENGYAATSPRAILDRSGTGQGSLYHHFRGGKPELAVAALECTRAEMEAEVLAMLAGEDPIEAVRLFVVAPRHGVRGCRLGRLTAEPDGVQDVVRAPVAAYFNAAESAVARRLTEAASAGRLAIDADPADLAAALVAAVQGGYVLARAHGNDAAMVGVQRGAVALLLAATVPAA
jgi:TetR/AcrR family transcriptional repressor of nem operon